MSLNLNCNIKKNQSEIKYSKLLFLITALVFILSSCASVKTTSVQESSIKPRLDVVIPQSPDINKNKQVFDIFVDETKLTKIESSILLIKDINNLNILRSEVKNGIKSVFEWDCKDNTGDLVSSGSYLVTLVLNYKSGEKEEVQSKKFDINNSSTEITASITPYLFSPDKDGTNDILYINIKAKDPVGIKKWFVTIMRADGQQKFVEFTGNGEIKDTIMWNGIGNNGDLVESAQDYPVSVSVENNNGIITQKQLKSISVDVLVNKIADARYKIRINNVLFTPDSKELLDEKKNIEVISKLSSVLLKFNNYSITIEGYVNPFVKGKYVETLGKQLSKDRANAVARSLANNGISMKRMTVIGKGGKNPIVFKNDKENVSDQYLEKNMRVEFYLNK